MSETACHFKPVENGHAYSPKPTQNQNELNCCKLKALWKQRPNMDTIEVWWLPSSRVASLGHRWGAGLSSLLFDLTVYWRPQRAVASRAGNLSLFRITLFQRDQRVAREAAGPPIGAWCLGMTALFSLGQALTLKSCAWSNLHRELEDLHLFLIEHGLC